MRCVVIIVYNFQILINMLDDSSRRVPVKDVVTGMATGILKLFQRWIVKGLRSPQRMILELRPSWARMVTAAGRVIQSLCPREMP